MAYVYEEQRDGLFTDDGQRMFLAVRDKVKELIALAGAVRLQEVMTAVKLSGDSWQILACFDRLVELGEIVEIKRQCAGQHRVFVAME
jgi:hypothetical protein